MKESMLHVSRGGNVIGKFPSDEARAHLASGLILPTDLAWREGMVEWRPTEEVLAAESPILPAALSPDLPPVLPRSTATSPSKKSKSWIVALSAIGVVVLSCVICAVTGQGCLGVLADSNERRRIEEAEKAKSPTKAQMEKAIIDRVKDTMTKISTVGRKYQIGPLEGGTAVMVDNLGAYWVKGENVYAANGFAKTWSPAISYSANPKVTFTSVKGAVR